MMLIDAHQHFWALETPGLTWPDADLPPLYRDFTGADLRAAFGDYKVAGTILVQSQPTDHDTDWLLKIATPDPMVRAIVGWADLASPDAPSRIAALAVHPKLKGLRPMLQGIADTDWLMHDSLAPALDAMVEYGLRLDALVQPRHLPMLARFARRWPDLPIVIDHAGKPALATGDLGSWADDIAALADLRLYCKLSGLRTEQAPGAAAQALAPVVAHLLGTFGERLMWGSDWPVLLLAGDAWDDWARDAAMLAGLSGAAHDRLFGGCAAEFYAIDRPVLSESPR
jgi:L-fuconolactonase